MSILNIIKVALGKHNTASENHFFDGSVANQLTLKKGTPAAPGADVMTVDAAGKVAFPQNTVPAFRAVCGSFGWGGSAAKLPFTSETFDTANCFDLANGRFTPAVSGYYHFISRVQLDSGNPVGMLYKNGSRVVYACAGNGSTLLSDLVYLNGSTDYVELWCLGPAVSNLTIGSDISYLAGYLVRAA